MIESKARKLSLNKAHVFEWIRDDKGMMTLAMDGKQLFRVSDRRYMKGFSGLVLSNLSGSMILHDIKVLGKK